MVSQKWPEESHLDRRDSRFCLQQECSGEVRRQMDYLYTTVVCPSLRSFKWAVKLCGGWGARDRNCSLLACHNGGVDILGRDFPLAFTAWPEKVGGQNSCCLFHQRGFGTIPLLVLGEVRVLQFDTFIKMLHKFSRRRSIGSMSVSPAHTNSLFSERTSGPLNKSIRDLHPLFYRSGWPGTH